MERQLRAEDERLLAAVHQGGKAEWSQVITPDFIYVEEGGVTTRGEFLAGLVPDGNRPLHINDYRLVRSGDVALVMHRDDVPDPVSGALTTSQYLMTETWQLIGGAWKLHVVHVDAVHASPPTIALPAAELLAFEGSYRSGDRLLVIRREGGHLLAQVQGKAPFKLEPETRDVFFDRSELRRRWIFGKDASGKVTLVHRDENSDGRPWTRDGAKNPAA